MTGPITPSAAPGWYPDPHLPGTLRFFDGGSWTPHVAPVPAVASASVVPLPTAPWTATAHTAVGAAPSDPVHWLIPTGRSWQSIAAGYVALFALVVWILGPVALVLGVSALRASSTSGTHGRGRAIFAIVVGSLATLGTIAILGSVIAG